MNKKITPSCHPELVSGSICQLIATLGYVGFFPWAPGTVASLVTVVLVWVSQYFFCASTVALVSFFSGLFFLGWYVAGVVEAFYKHKDPSFIVIDEVVGMGLASAYVGADVQSLIIVFVLFRLFDIVKPFPINLLDQKCTGGFGIMIDDLGAALAALFVFKGISLVFFF